MMRRGIKRRRDEDALREEDCAEQEAEDEDQQDCAAECSSASGEQDSDSDSDSGDESGSDFEFGAQLIAALQEEAAGREEELQRKEEEEAQHQQIPAHLARRLSSAHAAPRADEYAGFAQSQSILLMLPWELLLQLVKWLSAEELVICARTCRALQTACGEPTLWRRLYRLRWGAADHRLVESQNHNWKVLYIERDGEDIREARSGGAMSDIYVQMHAAKRAEAPSRATFIVEQASMLGLTTAEKVALWRKTRPFGDSSKHTDCSCTTCTYHTIDDVHLCTSSGKAHVCDDACREDPLVPSSSLCGITHGPS